MLKKVLVAIMVLHSTSAYCNIQSNKLADELDTIVNYYAQELGFNGVVLVGKGNEVLFQKGVGFANIEHKTIISADTPFRLASLTKQFTATAILLLERQGLLKLDQPLSTYLPELNKEIADKVNIRQLLNHSSGLIRDIEELSDLDISKRYVPIEQIFELISDSEISFTPGSKFSYSNLGFNLLAVIIERLTGKSYKEALDDLIFTPNKLHNTTHDDSSSLVKGRASGYLDLVSEKINAPFEDKSYVIGAGSIMSSANDLFRWSQSLFKGDVLSQEQLLQLQSPNHNNYSFGWFIDQYEWNIKGVKQVGTNINHDGGSQGFLSSLSYLKEHDTTIILLSNVVPGELDTLNKHLIQHLLGAPQPFPLQDKKKEILEMLWSDGVNSALKVLKNIRNKGNQDLLPGSFELILVGRAYLDAHRYVEAEKIFSLVALDQYDWEYGHLFLGILYMVQNDIHSAHCAFSKTLEVAPNSSTARSEMNKIKVDIDNQDCSHYLKL